MSSIDDNSIRTSFKRASHVQKYLEVTPTAPATSRRPNSSLAAFRTQQLFQYSLIVIKPKDDHFSSINGKFQYGSCRIHQPFHRFQPVQSQLFTCHMIWNGLIIIWNKSASLDCQEYQPIYDFQVFQQLEHHWCGNDHKLICFQQLYVQASEERINNPIFRTFYLTNLVCLLSNWHVLWITETASTCHCNCHLTLCHCVHAAVIIGIFKVKLLPIVVKSASLGKRWLSAGIKHVIEGKPFFSKLSVPIRH